MNIHHLVPSVSRWLLSMGCLMLAAGHASAADLSKFKRIEPQFIAALGDPVATSGNGAQAWGFWNQDPGQKVWIVVDQRYSLQELREGSFRRLPCHRPRRRGHRHGIAGLRNGPAAVSRYLDQSFGLQSFGKRAARSRRELGRVLQGLDSPFAIPRSRRRVWRINLVG